MLNRLTTKSIFFNWQTIFLLLIFFTIKFTSFVLVGHSVIQAILVFLFVMIFGILYFKNPDWAWYILIGELFLGGSGQYLEFVGLSIRTLLIGTFLFLWTLYIISKSEFRQRININKTFSILLIIFYACLGLAVINGLYNQHTLTYIIQDLMPFLYLPLVFPTYHLLSKQKTQEYFIRLIIVFLIGSALFSIFTFTLFSGGYAHLQDPFYKWFRDVAAGKITDMENGFFRIVLPEHLIITPIILIISSLLMRDEKHHKMWRVLLILSSIILVLNLSRAYLLALIIGLIVLKYKHKWHRWLIISSTTLLFVFLFFTTFSIAASGGKTLGWELFGVRLNSFANPTVETSSATRMMVLPAILEIIKANPILGTGIGSTVTFTNTITYEQITTRHFDWGYFEMLAEFGIFGTLALLALIFFIAWKLLEKIKHAYDWHDFYVGLLAGIVAMLVINLTAPALFHVFGIIFFVLVMAIALKPVDIFEKLITVLYRIFNRLKT